MKLVHIGPTVEEWDPPLQTYDDIHSALVHEIVVLPDGKTAVSSSEDSTVRYWSIDTGEVLGEITGHAGPVNDLALHGSYLATAGDDRTVRVWDVRADFEPKYVLEGHERYVRQVALTDELVVTVCEDAKVRVFRLHDGELVDTLEGHNESIQSVGVSPDGRFAVTASLEHAVLVWDLKEGKALEPMYNADVPVHHMGFGGLYFGGKNYTGIGHFAQTPTQIYFLDDDHVLTASDGVIVWDFAARKEKRRLDNFAWAVQAIAIDAERVFAGTHTEIRGMNRELNQMVFRCPAPERGCTALCLAGDRLLVGGQQGTIQVIDVSGWMPEERHISGAFEAIPTPNEELVATIDSDSVLRLWDFDRGEARGTFDRYSEPNTKPFAFDADSKRLATTLRDMPPAICVWDIATRELLAQLDHEDEDDSRYGVHSLAFVDDGILVGPAATAPIQVWSLDGKDVRSFKTATTQISNVTRNGDFVVSVGYFAPPEVEDAESVSQLQAWRYSTGELLWTRPAVKPEGAKWAPHFDDPRFLEDGTLVTSSGMKSGEVSTYDIATGEVKRTWDLGAYVTDLQILGSSAVAATRDSDANRTEVVWFDLDGDITERVRLDDNANRVQLAPGANRVIWANEKTLVLAELSTGKVLASTEMDDGIVSLALRGDGQRVFAGLDSGRVRVFVVDD